MFLCPSPCVKPLTANPLGNLCDDNNIRTAGIKHLIAATCDVEIEVPTDYTEWKTFADEGKILLSPKLLAEKPETDDSTLVVDSCGSEVVIQETHTLSGTSSYFTDENEDIFNFWADLKKNLQSYRIGWIDCNDRIYINGKIPGFRMTGKINHIVPPENTERQHFLFNLQFKSKEIIKPITVEDFYDAFS